jgi:hypothetical protein
MCVLTAVDQVFDVTTTSAQLEGQVLELSRRRHELMTSLTAEVEQMDGWMAWPLRDEEFRLVSELSQCQDVLSSFLLLTCDSSPGAGRH